LLLEMAHPASVGRPSLKEFTKAFFDCFWASLQTDETRQTRASLVFAAPGECTQYIHFEHPEECSARSVRALSHIANPYTSALAFSADQIWGVALTLPTDSVFISIQGPGRLLVRVGEHVVASLAAGALHRVMPRTFASFVTDAESPSSAELLAVEFLRNVSIVLRRLAHGGMIIFNPQAVFAGLDPHHNLDPEQRLRNWSQKTAVEGSPEAYPSNMSFSHQAELELSNRRAKESRLLESIGYLSAIDGAVIVSDDLSIRGFGAKITCEAKPTQIEVLEFPDYEARPARLKDLGGTRHQSAARYAWLHDQAVVLTVSQDGLASIFRHVKDGQGRSVLRVYRGFEATLPLDANTLSFGHYLRASQRPLGTASCATSDLTVPG
jgi:hypothetical protein